MNAPTLRDLQEAFADAVLGGAGEAIESRLDTDPEDAARRVAIYRRSVGANLVRALRGAFPVIARLVGDAFFNEAARRYGLANAPSCGDLNRYGEGFADFLARYPHAAGLPWLGDAARLDWACHEASMAGDGETLDFAALAAVPGERQGALRFRLHPAVRLVRSPWPVLAIWEANQPDRDGTPDRDKGPDDVLVWREAGTVRATRLDLPEAAFVEALARGARLDEAAGEAQWDLPGFLARLAGSGVLDGFRA